MGKSLFSNKINKNELKRGDHIYSYRRAHSYSHHGIYVGYGRVIHYTRTNKDGPSFNVKKLCRRSCGFDPDRHHGVVLSCLDCFLSDHTLRRFEYGVSEKWFALKRSGTCTPRLSDPPENVLKRAYRLLKKNGFGDYHLFENNCEDFAAFCKMGQGISWQMASHTSFIGALVSIVGHKLLKYDLAREMKMTDPKMQEENAVYRIRDHPESDEDAEEEDKKGDEDDNEDDENDEEEDEENDYDDYDDHYQVRYLKDDEEEEEEEVLGGKGDINSESKKV